MVTMGCKDLDALDTAMVEAKQDDAISGQRFDAGDNEERWVEITYAGALDTLVEEGFVNLDEKTAILENEVDTIIFYR